MSVTSLLKQVFFTRHHSAVLASDEPPSVNSNLIVPMSAGESTPKKVLNVGGNNRAIAIPNYNDGWTHHLLDIDPKGEPDIVCDARSLAELKGVQYDSVYCSHNLEHYYSHDVVKVLNGFHHILSVEGFVDVRVPDMQGVVKHMVANDLDIDDVLYTLQSGEPIHIKDVMYGWGREIEESGQDFFDHKTGFSEKSLTAVLVKCGFSRVYAKTASFEIKVLAFKNPPSPILLELLGLPSVAEASTD